MKQLNYKIALGIAMALGSVNAFADDFPDVDIISNGPNLTFDDNSTIAGNERTDWEVCVDDNCVFSTDEPEGGFSVTMRDNGNASTDRRPLTIQNNVRTDALRLNGNNVGMGTATPAEELHIYSPNFFNGVFLGSGNAAIRLESQPALILPGGSNSLWDINGGTGSFYIEDGNSSTQPFRIDNAAPTNALVVDTTGGVGVGTSAPESNLHVIDNSASVAVRNVVKLSNNGPVGFELEDTDAGNSWDFRTAGNGGFLVSNIGVPGSKIQVNLDGSVFLNGGGFSLNGTSNNVTVGGSVTAQGVLLTSSKHSKTDVEPINPAEVMKKLKQVEVAEWRYKKADKNDRHISPMAEDFYSLFKLGPNDKYINPNDLASVAIIAAKELQKKSEVTDAQTIALKAEVAALKAENSAFKKQLDEQGMQLTSKNQLLQERLASLEKLITNIAAGDGMLPEKGNKVVLK